MKQIKRVERLIETVEAHICNKCGATCDKSEKSGKIRGINAAFFVFHESLKDLRLKVEFPESTDYNSEIFSFDLCEFCLFELICSFTIPCDIV